MNPFKPRWPWWLQVLTLIAVFFLFALPADAPLWAPPFFYKAFVALGLIIVVDLLFEWWVKGKYREPGSSEEDEPKDGE